jgi:hypothetical protein
VAWGEKLKPIPKLKKLDENDRRLTAPATLITEEARRSSRCLRPRPSKYEPVPMLPQPKVFAPTGKSAVAPWSLLIERKKRDYAGCDLYRMISEAGVPPGLDNTLGEIASPVLRMSLEAFDDSNFDERTFEDLERLVRIEPIRAVALKMSRNEAGTRFSVWIACAVKGVCRGTASEQVVFDVAWADGLSELLPRLRVLLWFENPDRFVARLKHAWMKRQAMCESLRLSVYLGEMPTGNNTRDLGVTTRIRSLVMTQKRKPLDQKKFEAAIADATVSRDVAINSIILAAASSFGELPVFTEARAAAESLAAIRAGIPQPPPCIAPGKERRALLQRFPEYAERRAALLSKMFLTTPEVIRAWVRIRTECEGIQARQLFVTRTITKTNRIEEFEETQTR